MASYHHGNLPQRLLELSADLAAEKGIESVTLRDLARRAGVSHSAPVHHFKSRINLLTALAVQGFESLNSTLEKHFDDIFEMGVSYVLWAVEHPGHYAVMWQPRHLATDDERLNKVRNRAWSLMASAVAVESSDRPQRVDSTATGDMASDPTALRTSSRDNELIDAYAAFSVVHGLAGIWLTGALEPPANRAPFIREVTRRLAFAGALGRRTDQGSDHGMNP